MSSLSTIPALKDLLVQPSDPPSRLGSGRKFLKVRRTRLRRLRRSEGFPSTTANTNQMQALNFVSQQQLRLSVLSRILRASPVGAPRGMDHRDDCGTSPGESLAHEIREAQITGAGFRKFSLTVAGFFLLTDGNVALPCQFSEADDEFRPQQFELPREEFRTVSDLLCTRLSV